MSDNKNREEENKNCIKEFNETMLYKLNINNYKEHWSNYTINQLSYYLELELGELQDALLKNNKESIKLECADIANFAMMIYDNINKGLIK
jgi:NTP pyrophosphatase (non-canonical NTP hydrolase)